MWRKSDRKTCRKRDATRMTPGTACRRGARADEDSCRHSWSCAAWAARLPSWSSLRGISTDMAAVAAWRGVAGAGCGSVPEVARGSRSPYGPTAGAPCSRRGGPGDAGDAGGPHPSGRPAGDASPGQRGERSLGSATDGTANCTHVFLLTLTLGFYGGRRGSSLPSPRHGPAARHMGALMRHKGVACWCASVYAVEAMTHDNHEAHGAQTKAGPSFHLY